MAIWKARRHDKLLEEVGCVDRQVYSKDDSIVLPNRNDKDGDTLKALFFDSFLDKIEKPGNKLGEQWRLAHKP